MRMLCRLSTIARYSSSTTFSSFRFLRAAPRVKHVTMASQATAPASPTSPGSQASSVLVLTNAPPGGQILIIVPLNGGTRNLQRALDEPLGKALGRLRASVNPVAKAPKKKGKQAEAAAEAPPPAAPPTEVLLLDTEGRPVDEALTNAEAWRPGHTLAIGDVRLPLRVDPPQLAGLWLPYRPLVGHPLVPFLDGLENCSPADLTFQWTRLPAGKNAAGGEAVGSGRQYTPSEQDQGRRLRVEASLPGGGSAAFVTGHVQPAPHRPFADARRVIFGPPPAARGARDELRMASYNILADAYSHTWDGLYPYLSPAAAAADYRMQLALADVRGLSADIVCLQEVDTRWFERFWQPAMEHEGFVGFHTEKSGATKEGCAFFARASRWRLAARREVSLSLTRADAAAISLELARLLADEPDTAEALESVTTCAQLAFLVPTEGEGAGAHPARPLVVGNTHLFFHPQAAHVRIIQAHALLAAAAAFAREHTAGPQQPEPGFVLCGDLNSEPFDGAAEYLLRGSLGADHPEWVSGRLFRWGKVSSRDAAARLGEEAALALRPEAAGDEGAALAVCAEAEARSRYVADTLQGRLEHLQRARNCLNTLHTFDREPQRLCPRWEGAAARGAAARGDAEARAEGLTAADGGAALREVYGEVAAHVAGECTYKTCNCLAAFELRRFAGLPVGLSLPKSSPERARAEAHIKAMREQGEADLAAAHSEQQAVAQLARQAVSSPRAEASGDAGFSMRAVGVGLELRHPFQLECASGFPEWTNFVQGFKGCLDYVWVDRRALEPVRALPMPPLEAVTAFVALPSPEFPSDHLAVAADVRFAA